MLKLCASTRQPLTLQRHKPIPIATYIPKFDEGYNPTRRFDPDSERVEQQKLKALYKKEKKGAVRELRKDNRFLAGEEARRKNQEDVTYQKKVRFPASFVFVAYLMRFSMVLTSALSFAFWGTIDHQDHVWSQRRVGRRPRVQKSEGAPQPFLVRKLISIVF